jgi:surface antigen
MKLIIAALTVVSLAACGTVSNQDQGALIGAVAGGIIGNQVGQGSGRVVATGIGALVGAIVGSNIGARMDAFDRQQVARTLETSPSGKTTTWRNPDTQAQYSITPRPAVERGGTVCREFTTVGTIGDKREQVVGSACRQSDGSWRMQ